MSDIKHLIKFDEKYKAATITHEELLKTMEIGDGFAELPKQCPMQPGALLASIVAKIKKYTGLDATQAPITIREQYCQVSRNYIREERELAYGDYLVKRFVTRIDVPVVEFEGTQDSMNPAIAISYAYTDNVKGVTIAFGESVRFCENLCVFGQYRFSTYGNSKVSFEEGMQLLDHWLQNMKKIHDSHIEVIRKLMDTKVPRTEFHRILGSLFEKAVRANNGEKIDAPLNQTQISAMVARGMEILSEHLEEDQDDKERDITAWDILSWGTEVLKPENSDMITLLDSIAAFNDFILREFGISLSVDI